MCWSIAGVGCILQGKISFCDGNTARKVQIDEARGKRALLTQIYVLLALPLLQAKVQLLAVILILQGAVGHAQQGTTSEYTVSEAGADIDTLVHLPEDLEVGPLADV